MYAYTFAAIPGNYKTNSKPTEKIRKNHYGTRNGADTRRLLVMLLSL